MKSRGIRVGGASSSHRVGGEELISCYFYVLSTKISPRNMCEIHYTTCINDVISVLLRKSQIPLRYLVRSFEPASNQLA